MQVGVLDTPFLPGFLTGPSLPAALRTVHDDIKTTALGLVVGSGSWQWLKPMLDACRTVAYFLSFTVCFPCRALQTPSFTEAQKTKKGK